MGTIMALQAFWPPHSVVDNLNVVRAIAKLLDHGTLFTPLPLVKNGDLIAIVRHMILATHPEVVGITEVKERATEADVEQGGVLAEDKFGSAEADTARRLWMSGVPWSMLGAFGTLLCCSCTGA